MKLNIVTFVKDYLTTAAWVTCDSGENTEFTKDAREDAGADCLKFIEAVKKEFGEEKAEKLLTINGDDLGYLAAHDFFLTRNGHGSNFIDKSEKYGLEEAKKLVEIAEKFKEVNCYHIRGKKSKLVFD